MWKVRIMKTFVVKIYRWEDMAVLMAWIADKYSKVAKKWSYFTLKLAETACTCVMGESSSFFMNCFCLCKTSVICSKHVFMSRSRAVQYVAMAMYFIHLHYTIPFTCIYCICIFNANEVWSSFRDNLCYLCCGYLFHSLWFGS